MQEDQENKPANPLLTLYGLNKPQFYFKVIGYVTYIALFASLFIFHNIALSGTIGLVGFCIALIYYVKTRKSLLRDYQAVNVNGFPLLPAHSVDFLGVWTAAAIVIGIFIVIFVGMKFPEIGAFMAKIGSYIAPDRFNMQ